MSGCVNMKCNVQKPYDKIGCVCVSCDGDFACCQACANEYKEQMAHFFNDIVHSPAKTEAWLRGEID